MTEKRSNSSCLFLFSSRKDYLFQFVQRKLYLQNLSVTVLDIRITLNLQVRYRTSLLLNKLVLLSNTLIKNVFYVHKKGESFSNGKKTEPFIMIFKLFNLHQWIHVHVR